MRGVVRSVGAGLALVLAAVAPGAAQGAPDPEGAAGSFAGSGSGQVAGRAVLGWATNEPLDIPEGSYTVTLVTGDRVVLSRSRGGATKVAVTPARRTDGSFPGFLRMEWQGHYYVIPDDVADLVPGQLDRRLFDVTGLVAAGYDDAHADGVPVLVQTSQPGATVDPAAGTDWDALGVSRGRSLRSIGAVAAEVSKERGHGRLVEAVRRAADQPAARGAGAPSVSRVWLDGRVRALDAVSTPQVGAPQAWAAGATGAGVTVAVLDTGVDAEHPDLADAVVAAEDFSFVDDPENPDDQPDPDDVYGHGTHVAGIITGNGAASGGEIVGVAPDAVIMNGKVLDDSGFGSDSQIIAGMEWAATGGADVVNMSLGLPGGYTDGTDPLAMAVDELSAAHDVLFVIAAGNEEGYGTVTTPGSASLALTVSAVDSEDVPTGFTSRGPRSDGGAKPDIAAPGQDILAPYVGWPDEAPEPYLMASGTSMAAPHVAGVAALVAQARPELDSQELKGVLVSSAEAVPAGVFDVGSGRVHAPSALDQQVTTVPTALGFGVFPFPQDAADPATQTLTYVNHGSTTLTLDLAAETTLQDGSPAPDGTLTLSADAVTVPPGGAAQVDVTVDPVAAGIGVGRVGGMVVATDGGEASVRTAVMSVNEPEMYDLTLVATDRAGAPGLGTSAGVVPLADQEGFTFEQIFPFFDENGTATVRLPVGPYGIVAVVPELDLETFETTSMDAVNVPEILLDAPTTVHLDATRARPVTVRTQKPSVQATVDQQLVRNGTLTGVILGYGAFGEVSLGSVPSGPVTLGDFSWMHRHLLLPPRASIDEGDYRYLYDLAYVERDRLPAGARHQATTRTTTQVDADFDALSDARSSAWAGRFALDDSGWAFGLGLPVPLPSERVEYVSAGPDVQWFGFMDLLDGAAVMDTPRPWVTEPGGRIAQNWLHQVHHHTTVDGFAGALFGEIFVHQVATASDDHGHGMFTVFDPGLAPSRARLWVDGALVADEPGPFAVIEDVPDPGTPVRALVETSVHHPEWARSTAYSTEWHYLAPPVAGEDGIAPVDLVNVRYGASGLDDHNRTRRTARLDLAVVDGTGAPAEGVRGLRMWMSGDRGQTWERVDVKSKGKSGNSTVTLVAPRRATSVSLRVEAWTDDARVVDTVLDAIALR